MALRHFLTLEDCTGDELEHLLARSIELKRLWRAGQVHEPLRNRSLAMIFALSSTRTRVAFEVGMTQLGGHALFLSPNDTHLGRSEPISDTARVVSGMVDLVMIRTPKHEDLEEFARYSRVPVINGMTSRCHPCQLLADMQTYVEHRGSIRGKTVAFVGDGYNMCHSYVVAAKQFGFHLRYACPEGFAPAARFTQPYSNHITASETPEHAVRGADLVVTDVWSSMGHEADQARRIKAFKGYQIDRAMMKLAAPNALFMHCLPAHRGEEISDEMLDHSSSVVWDEAENRLHSQKALMEFLFLAAQHS